MRGRRTDKAEAGVIGEILIIGLVVVAAVGLNHLFGRNSEPQDMPASIGLTSSGRGEEMRALMVTIGPESLRWALLEPTLEGRALTYDAALSADDTFCIVASGTTCSPDDATRYILPGQEIRIHHSSIGGMKFAIRDPEANAVIYQTWLPH